LSNSICTVSNWEMKIGVTLHFTNTSRWSSTNRKGNRLPHYD